MEQYHKHYRASTSAMQKTDAESRLDDLDRNKMFKPSPPAMGRWTVLRGTQYRQQHANMGKHCIVKPEYMFRDRILVGMNWIRRRHTRQAGITHSVLFRHRQLDNGSHQIAILR